MSPIPAYTIDGLLGANAIQLTAMSSWSSLTGAKFAPPSDERQMPPVEDPTRTTCVSAGETATLLMRPLVPPQFFGVGGGTVGRGPRGVQTKRSPESDMRAPLPGRGRESQALRRAPAGTVSNG